MKKIVYKFYWRRGEFFKYTLNLLIILIVLLSFGISFINRLNLNNKDQNIQINYYSLYSNLDILFQGTEIESLSKRKPGNYFYIYEHMVTEGETLESISQKYNVTKDTIKWANQNKIDYYKEKIQAGDILQIPEIPGVLYEVQEDIENIDYIISKTSGDKFKVIEINQLEPPEYKVFKGMKILIPDGRLPPPPHSPQIIPPQNYNRIPIYQGINLAAAGNINDIEIINPLSNPMCIGYVFVRGFFPGHNGIDISKLGGCPIRAIAAGKVIFAGWSQWGEGYTIRIDHGNAIQSSYLHGETIWVNTGDYVNSGQEIMYMGTTGNSTGVHLHLSIKFNGVFIDPLTVINI